MTTSEEQMTIDEANAILNHYHDSMAPIIERTIIKIFKDNPSLDPTVLRSEIEVLKQKIKSLEFQPPQLAQRIDQESTDLEKILLSYTWKDTIPLAKESPVELTLFREIDELGTHPDWTLATLGVGSITKKGDKVRYACWDGKKVVWLHYTGSNPFKVQPAAVYRFSISKAIRIIEREKGKFDYCFAEVSVSPIFVKSLLELEEEHTPLRPQPYKKN